MSTMTKVFIVVNLLLSAIFLAASATLLGKSEHWMTRCNDEKAAHAKTDAEWKAKNSALALDKQQVENDKNKFFGDLQTEKAQKDTLGNQLEEQRKQNNDLRGDVGKINANLDVLKTAIKEKEALAAKLQ